MSTNNGITYLTHESLFGVRKYTKIVLLEERKTKMVRETFVSKNCEEFYQTVLQSMEEDPTLTIREYAEICQISPSHAYALTKRAVNYERVEYEKLLERINNKGKGEMAKKIIKEIVPMLEANSEMTISEVANEFQIQYNYARKLLIEAVNHDEKKYNQYLGRTSKKYGNHKKADIKEISEEAAKKMSKQIEEQNGVAMSKQSEVQNIEKMNQQAAKSGSKEASQPSAKSNNVELGKETAKEEYSKICKEIQYMRDALDEFNCERVENYNLLRNATYTVKAHEANYKTLIEKAKIEKQKLEEATSNLKSLEINHKNLCRQIAISKKELYEMSQAKKSMCTCISINCKSTGAISIETIEVPDSKISEVMMCLLNNETVNSFQVSDIKQIAKFIAYAKSLTEAHIQLFLTKADSKKLKVINEYVEVEVIFK